MTAVIRLAVIGTGRWGQNYVRTLRILPGCQLTYLVDTSAENLRQAAELAPASRLLNDYRQLLATNGFEAAIIATPAASHFEIARALLSNGKHILVEKPLARSSAEAAELVDISCARKCQLMVGHLLLYHWSLQRLKQLINTGELGTIRSISTIRTGVPAQTAAEDVLDAFAPHDIAAALYLLDAEPVAAQAAVSGNHRQPATVSYQVRFPRDVLLSGIASWESPQRIRRITVTGEHHTAIIDDDCNRVLVCNHNGQGICQLETAAESRPLHLQSRHFLDCIRYDRKPLSDGINGMKVVRVIEAIRDSIRQNGLPVPIKP